ncbi:MAG TPA: hypothetical protein VMG12_39240 [Polyangiaceae bacterium]|nr:hypothetical protein [Polyangiaceae bacterium]
MSQISAPMATRVHLLERPLGDVLPRWNASDADFPLKFAAEIAGECAAEMS